MLIGNTGPLKSRKAKSDLVHQMNYTSLENMEGDFCIVYLDVMVRQNSPAG